MTTIHKMTDIYKTTEIYTMVDVLNKFDNKLIFLSTVTFFGLRGMYYGLQTKNDMFSLNFHIIRHTMSGILDGIVIGFTWPISIPFFLLTDN